MCNAARTPADRQFRRKCQLAVSLSLLLYAAASQASLRLHHGAITGIVLAAVAGAAFFAELLSVGLLTLRLRDEFQRVLLTRSFVWATLITMAFSSIWGFVELHARAAVPHVDIIWIPMILIGVTAAAKLLIFRRYRAGE